MATIVAAMIAGRGSVENLVGKTQRSKALEAASQDAELSRKQASFVADQLVWDHIQERKHQGTIELPSFEKERSSVVAI